MLSLGEFLFLLETAGEMDQEGRKEGEKDWADDRSRTTRKMREALHEFSLVARGLDGTVYGSATS